MLETNQPVKPFLGVHFVLNGFDFINEQKVRVKLVDGGGVDAGQYNQNCTHVIVDKIVYDDPLCVAARKDCKTVVTALWVDHSYDIGMPVDAASIMYRPLKDLNGIPGAKSLIICLTGYQRQDRDDIMTMVSLMGAQFSKPLVANKVTHLICYKFEGEKYELAKKLARIQLVNHRWLEDCLRDWEILPEANYNKSGYELEMMEAEAKDSEEEAEDTSLKQYVPENVHKSPHNLKSCLPEAQKSPKLVADTLNMQASSLDNVPVSDVFGFQDVNSLKETTYNKLPNLHYRTPDGKNARNDLTSNSQSAERTPHSDGKFSAINHLNKTPTRLEELSSNGSGFDKERMDKLKVNDLSSSFFKPEQVKDRIGSDYGEAPQNGIDLHSGDKPTDFSPPKGIQNGSYTSPNLQKISNDVKPCIRKSPSPSAKIFGLQPASSYDDSHTSNVRPSHLDNGCTLNDCVNVNSAMDSHSPHALPQSSSTKSLAHERPLSKSITLESRQHDNANEKTSPSSFKRLKKSPSAGVAYSSDFVVGNSTDVAADLLEPQNDKQDVKGSAERNRDPETNSFTGLTSLNLVGIENLVPKPLGKKMVAKKTLGSRPKIGSTANQKGSIFLDQRNTFQNNAAICLSGEDNEKSLLHKNHEPSSLIVNNGATTKPGTKDADEFGDDALRKSESPDDETETPGEKAEVASETVNSKDNASAVQLTRKADAVMEEKSIVMQHLINGTTGSTHAMALQQGKKGNESKNAIDSNTSVSAEQSSKGDGLKRKKHKEKVCAVGKTKMKKALDVMEDQATKSNGHFDGKEIQNEDISALAEWSSKGDGLKRKKHKKKVCAVGKTKTKKVLDVLEDEATKSNEHFDGEEIQNEDNGVREIEKEKAAVAHPVAQSKHRKVSKNKLGKSVKEEKENQPTHSGMENKSPAKIFTEKPAVKSNTAPKSSPNSTRQAERVANRARNEPVMFILSGHRLQRKEFQGVIRRLKGKFCRDSHQWSYQATHFIAPDPIRRTEKFFAAAASGRWILKTDYLTASNQAGKFMVEEPYEWYKNGLSEDGAINLEAPRKWRLLRERTGHGAFHGMRIIIYGECIAPPLDTLKRVVKAGGGTILATSPPYTRFLDSGVDFAVVTPGMPRVDAWVQEFLKQEIPCVVADYLVEYVCKPGYSLEKHVLYNTHGWAEKSFAKLQARAEEVVVDLTPPDNDISCKVCGSRDRGEVMLICGDENGSTGCGVGCHIDCCDPPFQDIPEDDWFCSDCSKTKSSHKSKSSKKRKKGNSSLKTNLNFP